MTEITLEIVELDSTVQITGRREIIETIIIIISELIVGLQIPEAAATAINVAKIAVAIPVASVVIEIVSVIAIESTKSIVRVRISTTWKFNFGKPLEFGEQPTATILTLVTGLHVVIRFPLIIAIISLICSHRTKVAPVAVAIVEIAICVPILV